MTDPHRLYVYYRLAASSAAPALAAFERARAGAGVELLQRPELSDGLLTWMEVYAETSVHLEPLFAAALQPYVVGPRHVERFAALR